MIYLKKNAFSKTNYGCGDSFYKFELPEAQIHLHVG